MAITHPADLASNRDDYEIRKIGFDDLRISLRQGWKIFRPSAAIWCSLG